MSATLLTSFVVVQDKEVHVGVTTLRLPITTDTILPFSLQAPLTVYADLFELLIVGEERIDTVGKIESIVRVASVVSLFITVFVEVIPVTTPVRVWAFVGDAEIL